MIWVETQSNSFSPSQPFPAELLETSPRESSVKLGVFVEKVGEIVFERLVVPPAVGHRRAVGEDRGETHVEILEEDVESPRINDDVRVVGGRRVKPAGFVPIDEGKFYRVDRRRG